MKKTLGLLLLLLTSASYGSAPVGDIMTIALDSRFQSRVSYYLQAAAVAVMAESANTASHALRVQYANLVLRNCGNIYSVSIDVLTNASIAAELNTATKPDYAIPDSDIQFQVNALFNSLAGVAN